MRTFKLLLTALFFLPGIFSGVVYGGETVSFSWAFLVKSESRPVQALEFAGPEPVFAGELLRIYLEWPAQSFVYLYLLDSKEDLYLVFPPNGSFYNGDFPAGYQTYIPSGREWFALDELKGRERFYLLASNKRLFELEKLTDSFLASNDQNLKGRLQAELDVVSAEFARTSVAEIESVRVSPGNSLGNKEPLPEVNGQKILATPVYSRVLDLVNQ